MTDISAAFATAIQLLITLDANLIEIVGLSLQVSISAVALATVIGLPMGAGVGIIQISGPRHDNGDAQRADGGCRRLSSA